MIFGGPRLAGVGRRDLLIQFDPAPLSFYASLAGGVRVCVREKSIRAIREALVGFSKVFIALDQNWGSRELA